MPSQNKKVYFVLPVYNEEVALPALLETLAKNALPQGFDRAIVAVDDGSKDRSPHILADYATRYPIHIITHSPNKGVPAVFTNALAYLVPRLGDSDVVIIMEGDGTSDAALIPQLVQKISAGADVVIASRHIQGGAYVRFPWYRTFGSGVVNFTLSLIWRLKNVKDYTIFYRAYSGRILKQGFAGGVVFKAQKSFAVNGELLLILAKYRPHIEEIPLRYDYGLKSGPSKMHLVATLIEYMRLAVLYR